jgi:DNA-3-methyladenine glycosylase I
MKSGHGRPLKRCAWVTADPDYIAYHDEEWGVPLHDDRRLFEFIVLEGAQAGLSWLTILKKRRHYRRALDDFDPARIARYDEARLAALMRNPGLVRNRRKLEAAITNARAFLKVQEAYDSFDRYLWQHVDGRPRQNQWRSMAEVPAATPASEALSRDLKKRGFKFVGPVICYALMQAVGLVNDHTVDCFRHAEVRRLAG